MSFLVNKQINPTLQFLHGLSGDLQVRG